MISRKSAQECPKVRALARTCSCRDPATVVDLTYIHHLRSRVSLVQSAELQNERSCCRRMLPECTQAPLQHLGATKALCTDTDTCCLLRGARVPRSLIKPARCRVTAEIHFSTSKLVSRLLAPDDDARTQTGHLGSHVHWTATPRQSSLPPHTADPESRI